MLRLGGVEENEPGLALRVYEPCVAHFAMFDKHDGNRGRSTLPVQERSSVVKPLKLYFIRCCSDDVSWQKLLIYNLASQEMKVPPYQFPFFCRFFVDLL